MDEFTAPAPGPLVSIWPIRAAVLFSSVELLEVPIDPPLVERDAPLRGEIGGNARPRGDPLVQRDEARHLLLEPLHHVQRREVWQVEIGGWKLEMTARPSNVE